MAGIFEWLEDIGQSSYAPTSPPFGESHFVGAPMDEIMPFDTDENSNMYLNMPHAWRPPIEQSQGHVEILPINPSLQATTGPPEPATSGQTSVMVPEQFAEASRRLLIHLVQTVDIPETPREESAEEMMLTTDEIEILEPIDEETFETYVPNSIDGIRVSMSPQSAEIKEVIDLRRIGPNRQTFYLAKAIDGKYYWFHSPCAERNRQLRKLIGDYRHKSRLEVTRKTHGIKKLRSGRRIRI
jgi:hypothetical protein